MSVIGVISMKGGVGKTTLTANLAAALAAKLGPQSVTVVDLDPQNAVHLHLGVDDSEVRGVCGASVQDQNWRKTLLSSEHGVQCLPYGAVSEAEREDFENLLLEDPHWVGDQIRAAKLGRGGVGLFDTPPGPSVYLKQVFDCADMVMMVLLADAASYATVPAMETWLQEQAEQYPQLRSVYVLNQLDRSDVLNRDVANLLYQRLEKRLTPVHVHGDEAVREALAFQEPVLVYDPHGQASHDLARLADWLIETLSA
jgi:cellulose synthase operon protein YhjQ